MIEFKLPNFFWPYRRYGLVVSDDMVYLVAWRRGVFTKIAEFHNDKSGIEDFSKYATRNIRIFRDQSYHVVSNLIGEDYRFEHVPHLLGKYRTDFFRNKMNQLFRGAKYSQGIVQGREELGKREDHVLFMGIISEDKIASWVRELERRGAHLAGVYTMASMSSHVYKALNSPAPSTLLFQLHENGIARATFLSKGKVRFSRMTKIPEESSSAELLKALVREVDRLQQYLANLKMLQGQSRINVQVIAPSDIVGELRERIVSSDQADRIQVHDASTVASNLGVKRPLEKMGRDSSLSMHGLFSMFRWGQMAAISAVRTYWLSVASNLGVVLAGLYAGVFGLFYGVSIASVYSSYTLPNRGLTDEVTRLENEYQAGLSEFGEAPSSAENMQAVSNIFSNIDYDSYNPAPLLQYMSGALDRNPYVTMTGFDWYLSNDGNYVENPTSESLAYLTGEDIYQIIVLRGRFLETETVDTLLSNVSRFVEDLGSRQDMEVIQIKVPAVLTSENSLRGIAGEETREGPLREVALTGLDFVVQLAWKQKSAEEVSAEIGAGVNRI